MIKLTCIRQDNFNIQYLAGYPAKPLKTFYPYLVGEGYARQGWENASVRETKLARLMEQGKLPDRVRINICRVAECLTVRAR